MVGLDDKVTKSLNYDQAVKRILTDINTDFIFAPHFRYIYKNASKFLAHKLNEELGSGKFNFSLPLTMDIPKSSGLTRPGAILYPKDRLLYQVLADNMAGEIENNIDRKHVFSNILTNDENMFEPLGKCFHQFEEAMIDKSEKYKYCIKTDVTSFFETIYQHFVISQLDAINIQKPMISLLEKALLAWREDKSYGLLQGMYPSDLYGNYYLTQIDYFLELKQFDFIRFVDDIYIFSNSDYELRKILVEICNTLRQQSLYLNESKTWFNTSKKICSQQMEFDELFNEVTQMLDSMTDDDRKNFFDNAYGFQCDWDEDEVKEVNVNEIDGFRLDVLEELYAQKNAACYQKDTIIKFCLPLLTKSHSMMPFPTIKEDLHTYPHLTKFYSAYLATIDKDNPIITSKIEEILIENHFIFQYQQMWLFSALLYRSNLSQRVLRLCAKYFLNKQTHEAIRAICVIILSKHGKGHDRKLIRDEYNNEPSIYVRSAILYCTGYLSSKERHACKIAWGTNNILNELVIEAMK